VELEAPFHTLTGAGRITQAHANSLSLVRFDTNS
jgi:hypothetical protein